MSTVLICDPIISYLSLLSLIHLFCIGARGQVFSKNVIKLFLKVLLCVPIVLDPLPYKALFTNAATLHAIYPLFTFFFFDSFVFSIPLRGIPLFLF